VCHALLGDPAFFRFLCRIDAEFAEKTRLGRCPECSGPLHVGDFPRKPRGVPSCVRKEYSSRLSFTCGWCDARSTPASVRFLGRRVYVAVVLMLVSPQASSASRTVADLLEVPARTLKRWRAWWQREFFRTPFWQSVRDRICPPLRADDLPGGLLERFGGSSCNERMAQLLRFLSPLGTGFMSQVVRGPL
jgi:hypothetical protein